jgi:ATP-dependent Clp protease adapter protein ClpS
MLGVNIRTMEKPRKCLYLQKFRGFRTMGCCRRPAPVSTRPLEQSETLDETGVAHPATVILFNDEVHTFEEVIAQLVKALRCSSSRAEELALEAHTRGKAAVFTGPLVRCMEVSSILEEIALMTQIEV